MDMLCILAIYMAALICIVLTILTCAVLYSFLVAAYKVGSDWVQNLKWKRRCTGRKEE